MKVSFLLMVAVVMLITACPSKPVDDATKDDAEVSDVKEGDVKEEVKADAGAAKADAGAPKADAAKKD